MKLPKRHSCAISILRKTPFLFLGLLCRGWGELNDFCGSAKYG